MFHLCSCLFANIQDLLRFHRRLLEFGIQNARRPKKSENTTIVPKQLGVRWWPKFWKFWNSEKLRYEQIIFVKDVPIFSCVFEVFLVINTGPRVQIWCKFWKCQTSSKKSSNMSGGFNSPFLE